MRMDESINQDIQKLRDPVIENADDVREFYKTWMRAVWDYKLPSLLFDFYPLEFHVGRENGNDTYDTREMVKEVLAMQAAFPDIKIRVEAMVVVPDEEPDSYQIWARRYFNGTNSGFSRYGAPTGRELEGNKCVSQDMLRLRKVDGKWKVVNQWLMYSERTMRTAMGGPEEIR